MSCAISFGMKRGTPAAIAASMRRFWKEMSPAPIVEMITCWLTKASSKDVDV